jgi:hypothetical protein
MDDLDSAAGGLHVEARPAALGTSAADLTSESTVRSDIPTGSHP